ncbi:MAG: hypothetical protein ACRDKI_09310 [Solirubrobacterales bacterium]
MNDRPPDQEARVQPDPARRNHEIRGDAQTALLAAYAILAFAAVGRSTYELVTKFDEAPVAYSLSAFAAVVYCVATWAIWDGGRRAIVIGRISCSFEMIGVLVVGTITTFNSDAIADTVWSYYGRDYGWLPLVVPALALWWLFKQHPDR